MCYIADNRKPDEEGTVKTGEKIFAFVVAVIFVGCLAFESSMVLAVAHVKPFSKCTACMGTGGGGGF